MAAPSSDPIERQRLTLGAGTAWSERVPRGASVQIRNTHGTQGVAAFFWNGRDPAERLNVADTMKVQGKTRLVAGDVLLTDMGRIVAMLDRESDGVHDPLVGGSTPASVRSAASGARETPSAQDHFRAAAGGFGLDRRDVGPSIVFFAQIDVAADGTLTHRDTATTAGQQLTLAFAMDALAVISNTVHPLAAMAGATPRDVELVVMPPEPGRLTMLGNDPAIQRALDNTKRYCDAAG